MRELCLLSLFTADERDARELFDGTLECLLRFVICFCETYDRWERFELTPLDEGRFAIFGAGLFYSCT